MDFKKLRGAIFLFLAAFFWGTTFVAQKLASDSMGAFTYNGTRMIIGAFAILPVIAAKNKGKMLKTLSTPESWKALFSGGLICGVLMFVATNLQQFGIGLGTTAGKSGFITAAYVILVPLFGVFFRRRASLFIWGSALLCAVGMYFLCMADFSAGWTGVLQNLSFSTGDLLTLLCAVAFACHILTVDRVVGKTDGVWLSAVQFFVAGTLSVASAFLFETPTAASIREGAGAILYSAVFSCAIAYTCQILGQRDTPPALASILMCLEAVIAVIGDAVLLHTALSTEEILGCVLMFTAIVSANLSGFFTDTRKVEK